MTRFDRWLNVVTVVVLVLATGLFFHRNYLSPPTAAATTAAIEKVDNWDEYRLAGESTNPHANVQIVEFADYQCPFCKRFNETLQELAKIRPFGLVVLQTPIPEHEFATITANMAECAKPYDKFLTMNDLLYAKQDSFGKKPWPEYAKEAGIDNDNLASWQKCVDSEGGKEAIDRASKFARAEGVTGTPTVVINGWNIKGVNDAQRLDKMIANILQRKHPSDD